MAYTVALHDINDLVSGDSKNEILLNTKQNTELHIIVKHDSTIITLPFGNKFDIIDRQIIIHEK
jgi:hypothetical protein